MLLRKVELLKCVHDKLLITTHLFPLLAKCKLAKFLCFKSNAYLRLVKMMFYANSGAIDDKLSCYVMHKHLIIDFNTLALEFEMDASPSKVSTSDFPDYNK